MEWVGSAWGIVVALAAGIAIGLLVRRRAPTAVRTLNEDAVEIARLRSQVQQLQGRYHAQLEFFVNFPEVVKSLTAALTQEQVISACSRSISALLHTRQLAILLAESRTHLRVVDGAGFPVELRGQLSCPVGDAGLVDLLAQRGVSSVSDHPVAAAFLQRHELPAELATSIWYGEQQTGLILVARPSGEPQVVRRTLAMIADLTGVGLQAARQVSQIRDEAETDALTGLANRRSLLVRVNLELQRSRAYQSRTSLVMIDVDHFKHYNDHCGHAAGDQVLRLVAQLAVSATRRTDLVARYGGEEFTVVLSGADRDQAYRHADRIRRTIAGHPFPQGERQPGGRLSISMGVATWPDDADDADALFEVADRALYRAKESGRNRVVLYDRTIDVDRETGPKQEVAEPAASAAAAAPGDPSPPSQP
jgi:diguanylate cyclase (GGDEF)-like protein